MTNKSSKQLSLEAQEVFWAFNSKFEWVEDGVPGPQFRAIAEVLETIANQAVPLDEHRSTDELIIRSHIIKIAKELKEKANES